MKSAHPFGRAASALDVNRAGTKSRALSLRREAQGERRVEPRAAAAAAAAGFWAELNASDSREPERGRVEEAPDGERHRVARTDDHCGLVCRRARARDSHRCGLVKGRG